MLKPCCQARHTLYLSSCAIRVVAEILQKRFNVVVVLLSQYKLPNLLLAEAF